MTCYQQYYYFVSSKYGCVFSQTAAGVIFLNQNKSFQSLDQGYKTDTRVLFTSSRGPNVIDNEFVQYSTVLTLSVKLPYYGIYEDIWRSHMSSPYRHCESAIFLLLLNVFYTQQLDTVEHTSRIAMFNPASATERTC